MSNLNPTLKSNRVTMIGNLLILRFKTNLKFTITGTKNPLGEIMTTTKCSKSIKSTISFTPIRTSSNYQKWMLTRITTTSVTKILLQCTSLITKPV